jgi:membrane associated rhomboid family serine protease
MFLIPYRDYNRPDRFPIMTYLIIAANLAMFGYTQYLSWTVSEKAAAGFVQEMGVVPRDYFDPRHYSLMLLAAPFTSLFMHGGVIHIAFNMLYLWIFGDDVEDRMGRFQFLFYYLVCGLGAVALHMVVFPRSPLPLIGASGAIFGVMAAYVILFPGARLKCVFLIIIIPLIVSLPALLVIGYFLILQIVSARIAVLSPYGSPVAWFAHIGGFLTGVFYVHRMKRHIRPPRRVRRVG